MWNSTKEYRVSVLIKGRKPASEVEHQGSTYIEGREGTNYELELENNSGARIMFVPSVDGLSILDGKPAGVSSPGYVVNAHTKIRVPGWKVDGNTAAEFVFGKVAKGNTYAEASGENPANQGVIGCMIFKEKYIPDNNQFWNGPTRKSIRPMSRLIGSAGSLGMRSMGSFASTPTYASNALHVSDLAIPLSGNGNQDVGLENLAETSLGTEWGDAVDFKTKKTDFVKEHNKIPNAVFVFYYDTLTNLKYIGVPVERFRADGGYRSREAFPADKPLGATPPPGWTARYKKRRSL